MSAFSKSKRLSKITINKQQQKRFELNNELAKCQNVYGTTEGSQREIGNFRYLLGAAAMA